MKRLTKSQKEHELKNGFAFLMKDIDYLISDYEFNLMLVDGYIKKHKRKLKKSLDYYVDPDYIVMLKTEKREYRDFLFRLYLLKELYKKYV